MPSALEKSTTPLNVKLPGVTTPTTSSSLPSASVANVISKNTAGIKSPSRSPRVVVPLLKLKNTCQQVSGSTNKVREMA